MILVFLEAELLYKPLCPSVGWSVGRSGCSLLFQADFGHLNQITEQIFIRILIPYSAAARPRASAAARGDPAKGRVGDTDYVG